MRTRVVHLSGAVVASLALLAGLIVVLPPREARAVGCAAPSFGAATNFSVGNAPYSVAVGDFNGDGTLDLATANGGSTTVSILLGDGTGSFAAATNFGVGVQPQSVAVGDFNGDGRLDLAVANRFSNNVSILLGDGAGSFAAATNFGVGTWPTSVAVGYFNRDGRLDLATANSGSNTVSILLGNGAGSFRKANFAVGVQPHSVAVGDFNGDGRLDLAVALYSSNTVSILLGDGTGGFAAATNFGVGSWPTSVAVGGFNGDGKLDLAVANSSSNTVSILLGDGAGGFAAATNFAVGVQPQSVAVGDFNGDGTLDLAVANYGSNGVSVLLGDGTGSFAAATNFGVGASPYSVAVGDFNGDGRPDLATANSGSGTVSVILHSGVPTTNTRYCDTVMSDAPVAYWRLGESAGPTASDETGTNPGTYVNVTGFVAPGALSCDPNTAVNFNQTNDNVEVPDSPSLNLTASFAIELWVKSNSTTQVAKYFLNKGNRYAVIYEYTNDTVEFYTNPFTTLPCSPRDYSAIPLSDTNWHHIVYSHDAATTTWTGYKDGVQIFTVPCDFTLTTDAGALFIAAPANNQLDHQGWVDAVIDEVALYNAPLSAARVQAHYNAASCPPPTATPTNPPADTSTPTNTPTPTSTRNPTQVVGTGTAASCTEAALDAALADGASVSFNCGNAPVTITATSTKTIVADTTIDGGGLVTLDGGNAVRVMAVNAGVTLNLQDLAIVAGSGGDGGGIVNFGMLTVTNSIFSGNHAFGRGGAIYNNGGTLTVTHSTFSYNSTDPQQFFRGGAIFNDGGALTVTHSTFIGNGNGTNESGRGGAIYNDFGGVSVTNSTFSGNGARDGGAIYNNFGGVSVTNSTFFDNGAWYLGGAIYSNGDYGVSATNSTFSRNQAYDGGAIYGSGTITNAIVAYSISGGNCSGTITDGGHNLQFPGTDCGASIPSADPLLDPTGLANNGGPTQTIALLPGSPAIDGGDDAVCALINNLDQRGFVRPGTGHSHCSIGAFEYSYPAPSRYGDAVMADAPVAYWRLGESLGSTASDETGSNPGTYVNVTGFAASGALSCDPNTAVNFNQTNDYVQVPNSPSLNLTTSFAIELWVKSNSTTQFQKYFLAKENRYAVIYGYASDTVEFFSSPPTQPCDARASSAIHLGDTNWHHIVYSHDAATTTWAGYKDGVQVFSVVCDFVLTTNSDPLLIGSARAFANSVDAVIDEVALYNAPLSASRVQAHYSAASCPPPTATATNTPTDTPTETPSPTPTNTPTPTLTSTATAAPSATPTNTPTPTPTNTPPPTNTPTPTNTPLGGCSATPSVVGTANVSQGTTGTTLSVTVGAAGVAPGNTILVGFTMDQTAGAVSCSDTAGNAYSVQVDQNNGTDLRLVICAAFNVAALSSGSTITVTHPSTANARNLSVEMVTGVLAALDQKAGATGTTRMVSSGNTAPTTQAAEVLYGVIGHRGPPTQFTAGSGFTLIGATGGTGTGNLRATEPEYQVVAATGQYAATGTLSTNLHWGAGLVTLKCGGAAPVTPTFTPTNTPVPPTPTHTPTVTETPTPTPRDTPTHTPTGTPTPSSTPTNTPTRTPTGTPTSSSTPTNTPTPALTSTATPIPPIPTPTNTPLSGCGATVSVVSTANVNQGTTGTTLSVTVGAAGVAAGNTILVGFTMDQTAGAVSCSDAADNAYSVQLDQNNGTDLRMVICAAFNVAVLVNGSTIMVTHPSTANARNMSVETVTGVLAAPLDQKAGATGSARMVSSGNTAPTTQAAEVLYGVIGHRGPLTQFTAGSGFTLIGATGGTGLGNLRATEPEYQVVAATGQYAATGTLSTNLHWGAGLVTLKCR